MKNGTVIEVLRYPEQLELYFEDDFCIDEEEVTEETECCLDTIEQFENVIDEQLLWGDITIPQYDAMDFAMKDLRAILKTL